MPISSTTLLEEAAEQLTETLALRACAFEPFPFDGQLPRIEPGRIVLPAAEPGVAPWTAGSGIELPVRFRGLPLGRFVLLPSTPTVGVALDPSARVDALAIAAEIGAMIGHALLQDL